MAFDQVSLFLNPPRWRRHSVADARMKHYSGEPVRVVSDVRVEDSEGPPIPFDKLFGWFEARDFEAIARSADHAEFCSATVESVMGRRPEINVHASAEDGEVTSLYCRFLLTRETPLRLERWEAFIHDLCTWFELRISASDTDAVGPEEFLTVVRGNDNWRYFAHQFGWSEAPD